MACVDGEDLEILITRLRDVRPLLDAALLFPFPSACTPPTLPLVVFERALARSRDVSTSRERPPTPPPSAPCTIQLPAHTPRPPLSSSDRPASRCRDVSTPREQPHTPSSVHYPRPPLAVLTSGITT
ncbi:hypothetical protein SCHPADRAFT_948081 [Schizopora paradoxa]|uniref:Uncharacterized protein n=1 Tax=Schizopora paradoxa TaxID=27342 RepID=A0A0H2R3I0_9AGAM|nr:hypothetical protein SCHPADRAFT_948081 [Schizopora paradoxa]